MSQMNPVTIDKFLGVNKSETETLLQLGEASESSNWIITDDNKLSKMFGYAKLFASLGNHKINCGLVVWIDNKSQSYNPMDTWVT